MEETSRISKTGLAPGSFVYIGKQRPEAVQLEWISYNSQTYQALDIGQLSEFKPEQTEDQVDWLSISGLHDAGLINEISEQLQVHPLILEDVMNTDQRPKIDIYEDTVFVVLKYFSPLEDGSDFSSEQVSLILKSGVLLSFHEQPPEFLKPVYDRLKLSANRLRQRGTDYLLYTIIDLIVDHYFVLLSRIEDRIDELEDEVIYNGSRDVLSRIHLYKRKLTELKRLIWPLREIAGQLLRDDISMVEESTIPFIRDLQDHLIQVVEAIEIQRDLLNGLLDIYLSSVSNRMNEVMKVLTIISTIFIPLSFLAGVFGMNFEYMPELHWKYSYLVFWVVIFTAASGLLWFFRRKRWL